MMRLLVIFSVCVLLAACGETDRPVAGGSEATSTFTPEPAVMGKPRPSLGRIEGEIFERPSPDRAWIRATWHRAPQAQSCALELVLPEGATLLEGPATLPIDADADHGDVQWLVTFPVDQAATATIRLCGDVGGEQALEAYLPLVR